MILYIFTIVIYIIQIILLIVKVKWGKETYSNVEVNTDDDPVLFKAQIFALTGVQPERQKVVCKGVTLRDDGWGNFKLSNVSNLLIWYKLNI